MRGRLIIVAVFVLFCWSASAQVQEVKFTQFFNFPISVDPAATGNLPQGYRLAGIYRQQWNSINAAFTTFGVSGDVRFSGGLFPGDFWGVGLYVIDDQLGDNLMQHQKAGLALAYHHPLDFQARHILSLGGTASYSFTTVDYERLVFESQYQGFFPDLRSPNGESFTNDNVGNYDIGAGISYRFIVNRQWETSFSASMLNLIAPQQTFLDNSTPEKALNRLLLSGWVRYKLNERVALVPRWLVNNQRKGTEVSTGFITEYQLIPKKGLQINAGLLAQWTEYVTFYAGAAIKGVEIHASYDFSVSGLSNIAKVQEGASGRPGVFEISLIYRGFKKKDAASYVVPCRIF